MPLKEYVFRDPVHGDIAVQDPTIIQLINAPEFQRLRRIRQLGTSFISYPGAEHTRFAHSIGVYHLMKRVLDHLLAREPGLLDPETRVLAMAAALLHDIGHGPFSHLFEKLTGMNHEEWVVRILTDPGTEVNRVLRERHPTWPEAAAALVSGRWEGPPFVAELLSSQLDVDRMDYLLRDSLMCGVSYGRYDLERLLSTLTVYPGPRGPELMVAAKGQGAVEAFLLARYFMYWNVYFHKATRAVEMLLEKLLQRVLDLLQAGDEEVLAGVSPALVPVLRRETPSLDQYLSLDEVDVLAAIKVWAQSRDPVLADLARRFLHRRLFKGVRLTSPPGPALWERLLERVAAAGFNPPEYYLGVDRTENVAYSYYYLPPEQGHRHPIRILDTAGGRPRIEEISRRSRVLAGITEPVTRYVLFLPKEVADEVMPLLEPQLLFDL